MIAQMMEALSVTIRHLFRPLDTFEYPKVKRPRAERYRASFALLHEENGEEACIGCKMCQNICPSQVIDVQGGAKRESPVTGKKRGYADDFTLNLQACIFCELCVQVCPTDAIVMCKTQEVPGFRREDLVLTMDKLYANEKLKPAAWGKGSTFVDMHDSKWGLPKPVEPAKAEVSEKKVEAKAPEAKAAEKPPEAPTPPKPEGGGHG